MHLIYQYWSGDILPGVELSRDMMRDYAGKIGAEYRFERGGFVKVSHYPKHSDSLRPIWDDSFHACDKVLFLDADIYPVEGLSESVFDLPVEGIGICEEPHMPEFREGRKDRICGANDERWALAMRRFNVIPPRDEKGRLKAFNSGFIMYTKEGMLQARDAFVPIQDYITHVRKSGLPQFYMADQNYLHAMVFSGRVPCTVISSDWNAQIHGKDDGSIHDGRGPKTKFVHLQMSSADHFEKDKLLRMIKHPPAQW